MVDYDRLLRWRKGSGYVYLLRIIDCEWGGGDVYKVGFSRKPFARLGGIQASLPFEIALVSCFHHQNAANCEILFHLKFDSKRIRGEWYKLSSEDVRLFDFFFRSGGERNEILKTKYSRAVCIPLDGGIQGGVPYCAIREVSTYNRRV